MFYRVPPFERRGIEFTLADPSKSQDPENGFRKTRSPKWILGFAFFRQPLTPTEAPAPPPHPGSNLAMVYSIACFFVCGFRFPLDVPLKPQTRVPTIESLEHTLSYPSPFGVKKRGRGQSINTYLILPLGEMNSCVPVLTQVENPSFRGTNMGSLAFCVTGISCLICWPQTL